MEPVVGVFSTRKQAESAAQSLGEQGLSQFTLLTPGDWKHKIKEVRTEEVEPGGMGAALCGLVGCALGVAGGFEVRAMAHAILSAGFDPSLALEMFWAAALGAIGALAGIGAGRILENALCEGLPIDDLYIYEDALRDGRFVVIAMAGKTVSATRVRNLLTKAGAESLDVARRGLRPKWRSSGKSLQPDDGSLRLDTP